MNMDYTEEFDRLIGQMEWGDVVDTLTDVLSEMVSYSSNAPSSNSPHPAVPGVHIHHQPVDFLTEASVMMTLDELGNGWDPQIFEDPMMTLNELDGQHAAHNVGQPMMAAAQLDLLYQSNVYNLYGPSTITSSYAAPKHFVVPNLVPVQLLNGQVFIVRNDVCTCATSSLDTAVTKNRNGKEQQDDSQPYIKKPLNAFMLFSKEQRPNVVAELNVRDGAAVNRVLGQKWKMLSKEQQAKYYEEAAAESSLHALSHPGWSTSQNYGKKRKRQRRRAPTMADSTDLGLL